MNCIIDYNEEDLLDTLLSKYKFLKIIDKGVETLCIEINNKHFKNINADRYVLIVTKNFMKKEFLHNLFKQHDINGGILDIFENNLSYSAKQVIKKLDKMNLFYFYCLKLKPITPIHRKVFEFSDTGLALASLSRGYPDIFENEKEEETCYYFMNDLFDFKEKIDIGISKVKSNFKKNEEYKLIEKEFYEASLLSISILTELLESKHYEKLTCEKTINIYGDTVMDNDYLFFIYDFHFNQYMLLNDKIICIDPCVIHFNEELGTEV